MSEFAKKQPVLTGFRNEVTWQESNRLDIFFRKSEVSLKDQYQQSYSTRITSARNLSLFKS